MLALLCFLGCTAPDPHDSKSPDTAPEPGDSEAPPVDADGDGWTEADGDCDDGDGSRHPGAEETCNELDDNCNGAVDESLPDTDGDGTPDCRDVEACDGVDNDGDGAVDNGFADTDLDGLADCLDAEDCDGLDNDGNGVVDDLADADGDGFDACTDCDDTLGAVYPGAPEADPDRDDNCDGLVDDVGLDSSSLRITELMINPQREGDPDGEWVEILNTSGRDLDLGGLFVTDGVTVDVIPAGVKVAAGEYLVLGGNELPGENGGVDVAWAWSGILLLNAGGSFAIGDLVEVSWGSDTQPAAAWALDDRSLGDPREWWCPATEPLLEIEGDRGTPGALNGTCDTADYDGDGWSPATGDCDDLDPTRAPSLPETWYDGIDTDCQFDDDFDQDHDGVQVDGDCDDTDGRRAPGFSEVCDDEDLDEDCDGLADDADADVVVAAARYPDLDGDGYGDDASPSWACDALAGATLTAGDCDDADPAVSPVQVEVCGNGVDDDCDGTPNDCAMSGEYQLATDYDVDYVGGDEDRVGSSLLALGDLDADGATDLLVGAYEADGGGVDAGAVYVARGAAGGRVELGKGALITGESAGDAFGRSMAVGDFDGDGTTDVAIGATQSGVYYSDEGAIYLFNPSLTDDLDAPAEAWATMRGSHTGRAIGSGLTTIPDLDGDGSDELAFGAVGANVGVGDEGAVYVLAGPIDSSSEPDVADLRYVGVDGGAKAGWSTAAADFDGDGVADLAITTSWPDTGFGGYCVVSASGSGRHGLDEGHGCRTGEGVVDGETSWTVAAPGDVDGDGYADLVAADASYDSGTGRVYLELGPFAGDAEAAAARATFTGEKRAEAFGEAIHGGGDIDGDGLADLLIGAPESRSRAGDAYLYYGTSWTGAFTAGDAGASFAGSSAVRLGAAVLGGLDLDGDGFDDVVLGSPAYSYRGRALGAAWAFRGSGGR